jgi:hypothetical protein
MRRHARFVLVVLLFASLAQAGTFTYTLEKVDNPSTDQVDAYARIQKAMDSAVGYYDTYTDIRRHLTVQYDPSVATADGGGSNIRFGSSRTYMVVITAMHEIAHTVGVGTTTQYAAYVSNGLFTGPLATAALRQIEKDDTVHLHADQQHIWPYGLNYASEVKSTADLVSHCKIIDALYKDLFHETTYLEGRVRNVQSKQCLSLSGTALAMGSCTDTTSFVRIVSIGETNPVYRLELGDRVLDVSGQSTKAGVAVGTYTWNAGTNQEFAIEGSPLSSVRANRLKMVHSDLYLHPAGTAVVQDAMTTGSGFDWELIKGSVAATGLQDHTRAKIVSDAPRVDALGRRLPSRGTRSPIATIGSIATPK